VLEGEKHDEAKDYPVAKRFFENAAHLDPSAQYPKDQTFGHKGQFYLILRM